MRTHVLQHVLVDVAGQDDNLGDSALRKSYVKALAGPGRRLHLIGKAQTTDYIAGLDLPEGSVWYEDRAEWLASQPADSSPIHVFNAGEIDLAAVQAYPTVLRSRELDLARAGGAIIAAGIGIKNPLDARKVDFRASFRDADLLSWREAGSQEAAGFGMVNPDWAFALGSLTQAWAPTTARDLIAVTLRYDRPYPEDAWFVAARRLADATSCRIVTLAQVARDAPRALRLASDLGGEYVGAPSFSHDVLDLHTRALYARSLAVISDRAHGLIIGATEGAYPLGSAADPQKLIRLLDAVGLGALVGDYDQLPDHAEQVPGRLGELPGAIDEARQALTRLSWRIHTILGAVAS